MTSWKGRAGLLLALALVVAACAGPGASSMGGIEEGTEARDFTLENLEGASVSLSDYRGNVVLVNFWAAWCEPCRAEIPDFERAYRQHKDDGFIVLGINVEEPPQLVRAFVEDFGMSYPILLDETGQVMKMYRMIGMPISLIIDAEGVIRFRHVGYMSAAKLDEYLAQVLEE